MTRNTHTSFTSMLCRSIAAGVAGLTFGIGIGAGLKAIAADPVASEFKPVRIAPGMAEQVQLLDLLSPYLGLDGASIEQIPNLTLTVQQSGGGLRFALTATGYADDSVAGEGFHGTIIKTNAGWALLDLWVKTLCSRGQSTSGACL